MAAKALIRRRDRVLGTHRPRRRRAVVADGPRHGWTDYLRRIVWVNASCDKAERIRILRHDLAHIRCDHQNREITRAQGECAADSVAFVVCQSLGLDISSAVDYVATWAGHDDAEVLEEALTRHSHGRGVDPSRTGARRAGVINGRVECWRLAIEANPSPRGNARAGADRRSRMVRPTHPECVGSWFEVAPQRDGGSSALSNVVAARREMLICSVARFVARNVVLPR
jgi:hypothetical protein